MLNPGIARKLRLFIGLFLLIFSVYLLVRLFGDPVSKEITYYWQNNQVSDSQSSLLPFNTSFSLLIPKINASSPVVSDVDATNASIYQHALVQGIAHAKGTAKPGQGRNIFLFSHSSIDLLTALRYNSVFYLLHHLEPGDEIIIWYQDFEYRYFVFDKIIISSKETDYLTKSGHSEMLTLMTCWPPGTTLKRLIILAKPNN